MGISHHKNTEVVVTDVEKYEVHFDDKKLRRKTVKITGDVRMHPEVKSELECKILDYCIRNLALAKDISVSLFMSYQPGIDESIYWRIRKINNLGYITWNCAHNFLAGCLWEGGEFPCQLQVGQSIKQGWFLSQDEKHLISNSELTPLKACVDRINGCKVTKSAYAKNTDFYAHLTELEFSALCAELFKSMGFDVEVVGNELHDERVQLSCSNQRNSVYVCSVNRWGSRHFEKCTINPVEIMEAIKRVDPERTPLLITSGELSNLAKEYALSRGVVCISGTILDKLMEATDLFHADKSQA